MPSTYTIPARNVTLYTAKELQTSHPKAFNRAKDRWHECQDLTDDVTDRMLELLHTWGWTEERLSLCDIRAREADLSIEWSLSSCQGDGACFYGYIRSYEWLRVMDGEGTEYLARMREAFDNHRLTARIVKAEGRYCHHNTVRVALEAEYDDGEDTVFTSEKAFAAFLDELEGDMLDAVKGACKDLEREGYAMIQGLTGDDAFVDDCDARGVVFDANGKEYNLDSVKKAKAKP